MEDSTMGTVPTSAGLADLMQALSNAGSPLASTLSSPAVQSALENASPADIVKLSDQALALQETDTLFGISDSTTGSATTDGSNLLAALDSTLYGAQPTTQSTNTNPANYLLNVFG
jgi:hypothetical protein